MQFLRFRTETIKVKEMTYFFVVIGVSAINALSNDNASMVELSSCKWFHNNSTFNSRVYNQQIISRIT
ncbi:MAG: DUF4956 domain-containing protein [Flavobacteriaceae bacterium]